MRELCGSAEKSTNEGIQQVVVPLGLRVGLVKREIPSLRLKNGYSQDDSVLCRRYAHAHIRCLR